MMIAVEVLFNFNDLERLSVKIAFLFLFMSYKNLFIE